MRRVVSASTMVPRGVCDVQNRAFLVGAALSHGHGNARGKELEQGKVKSGRGHMETGWTSSLAA